MIEQGKTFRNARIDLHGKTFHNCSFEHCELVYDGDRPLTLKDNEFTDTTFVFTDAATRTLYLLSNIYHSGEAGREVVEQTFAQIRERTMHGHEIRTIAPRRFDHGSD